MRPPDGWPAPSFLWRHSLRHKTASGATGIRPPDEIVARQRVADRYAAALRDVAIVPRVEPDRTSVWAQYTIRLPGRDRNAIAARLGAAGVPTATHYPKPVHQQTAYRGFPVAGNGLPVSERLATEVLSLPMHPYLDEVSQDRVVAELRAALA